MTPLELRNDQSAPASARPGRPATQAGREAAPSPEDVAPMSRVSVHEPPIATATAAETIQATGPAQASKASAAPKNARVLNTYADFLCTAYGATRGRWKPTGTEIKSMHAGPLPDSTQRAELLMLAESDRALKRTRDVMLLGLRRLDGSHEAKPILGFVRDLLLRHPAYRSRSLVLALEHPNRCDDKRAVQTIADVNYRSLRWGGRSPLTKAEATACRANALHCLLLWFHETLSPRLPIERYHEYLRRELWAPPAMRRTSESNRVRILIKNRDHAATDLVCSLFEERIADLQRQVDASQDSALKATDQTRALEDSVVALQQDLDNTRTQLDRTMDDLHVERRERGIERAHLRDDYEKLRGRVLQRLDAELSLLKEGLHALRREPPKVGVMNDHAERVIEGLRKEVEHLRRG